MNKNIIKQIAYEQRFVAIHLMLFFVAMTIIYIIPELVKEFPFASLGNWDAACYRTIIDGGYKLGTERGDNTAFFPFFPFLWKYTGFGCLGISVLNLLAFYSGIAILFKYFKFEPHHQFVALSAFSLFYCYVPYSEAFAFLFGSIMLAGFKTNNRWMMYSGLFLLGITRAIMLAFIPMCICAEIVMFAKDKKYEFVINILLFSVVAFVSFALVMFFIGQKTGNYFAFFDSQRRWGHVFHPLKFPLTTWDNYRLIWLDGLAVLVGLTAAVVGGWIFVYKILRKKLLFDADRPFLLSIGYLAAMAMVSLFFTGYDQVGGTTLFSLNRYIFATPFFVVFIRQFYDKIVISWKTLLLLVPLALFWSKFRYEQDLLDWSICYYAVPTFWFFSYLFMFDKRSPKYVAYTIYVVGMIFQLYLFIQFTNGIWVA